MNLETLGETEQGVVGNTKNNNPRPNQLKKWFFTFNNYQEADIQILNDKFMEICDKFIFEPEIGESGTPHLQGAIFLKKAMRWTEFGLSDKIHWEKIKNDNQAIEYCQKDYKEGKTKNIYLKNITVKKPLKLITPNRDYQKKILDIIKEEPDERAVYWFYDPVGNVGKSQFSKYLAVKHNALYIDEGKKCDIAFYFKQHIEKGLEPEIVIFDIPRDNKNVVSYKSIEAIKSGMMFSNKYESGSIIFNSPHIFIFSNYLPDTEKLSLDRWRIFKIDKDYKAHLQPPQAEVSLLQSEEV